MANRTQRIRDPIHGLIVFDENSETDMLAWSLIQTPDFQRLRRIKQLGLTEFVFPGATHSRFAHSIGVFHNARKLMKIIEKEMGSGFSEDRARVAIIAALLHDIGHGPFSHAFEGARSAIASERGGAIQKHEKFSARIIEEGGDVRSILDRTDRDLARQIAQLLEADDPVDFYHAVVSSSFDADRLDYLIRDRYMTGTQAGSIDDCWLLDNLTTHFIKDYQDGDDDSVSIPTFVFKAKARHAAEDFLLARFRLYHQVYMHKTTRGFEQLLQALLKYVGAESTDKDQLGLVDSHPLMSFLAVDGETLDNYRRLDDFVVWGAIEQLAYCSDGKASDLANRLLHRNNLRVLDVSLEFENHPGDLSNATRRLDSFIKKQQPLTIFKDAPSFNLYSEANGEAAKAHKIVRVLDGAGNQDEIVKFGDTIINDRLMKGVSFTRYYFLSAEDKDAAEKIMKGG